MVDMVVDKEGKTTDAAAAQGELRMTAPDACKQQISLSTVQAKSAAFVVYTQRMMRRSTIYWVMSTGIWECEEGSQTLLLVAHHADATVKSNMQVP